MAPLVQNRFIASIILVFGLLFIHKQSVAQAKIGNLLIYTVDKKGKPYSDYLVKLEVYYPEYERYLPYEEFATFVYNDLGMNISNNLPQGKYQIYVQCSRTQTEAVKEIYFTPSKRISQIAITLDQEQYWQE